MSDSVAISGWWKVLRARGERKLRSTFDHTRLARLVFFLGPVGCLSTASSSLSRRMIFMRLYGRSFSVISVAVSWTRLTSVAGGLIGANRD
jgi:hypothetical protein